MKNNLAHLRPSKMSSEKNITVIQCTSCQTKFAVETAAIASEKSRFHCSRCDNVFSLEKSFSPEKVFSRETSTPARTPTPKPEPVQPQFTFDWKQASVEESDDTFKIEAPDFDVSVAKSFSNDPLAPLSDDELGKELFAGLDEEAVRAVADEPMGYGSLARTTTREFSTDWDPTDTVSPLTPTTSGARISQRIPAQWGGFFQLVAPIAAYTGLLGLICILSFSNPKFVLGMIGTISSGAETAAPPELYITDTAVKKVVLESGETVNVISGKIVNESQQNFSEVLVEGILFGSGGDVVARKKINAGSSLGKSRLQSLSLQMIDDLQNTRPAKRFELKAGQEYDFTMAVSETDSPIQEPAFYSSRVYSVRM